MPIKHSLTLAGGSTASRTIKCPGWRTIARTYAPDRKSSDAADEGSMLHDCAELVLKGAAPETLLGFESNGKVLTEELMIDKLLPAIEAFDKYIEYRCESEPEYVTEVRVALNNVTDAFGTSDVVMYDAVRRCIVILDWKFGYISVSSKANDQLAFYCNGVLTHESMAEWVRDALKVEFVIIQGGHYDAWETTLEWVASRKTAFAKAIEAGDKGTGAFAAGEHCKFCPVLTNNQCPEHKVLAQGALDAGLAETVNDDLSYWMSKVSALESFTKSIKAATHSALESGWEVEGFKLVSQRKTRKWKNESETEATLRKISRRNTNLIKTGDLFNTKMKSPAQVEALFKKHNIDKSAVADQIESISSGTTVAPADDKRQEIPGLKGLVNLGKL